MPFITHRLAAGAYFDYRYFHTFFELVINEMPLSDAESYVKEMRDFYTAGWIKIMGQ